MKIISLISSYRKDGNTNRLIGLIEDQLLTIASRENINLDIERIQLGHRDIKICRGCRVCFDRREEECPLQDELLLTREKVLKGQGILVASPVYVENINGIMKNWIDRMAFNCHRPAFAGKIAYIITTSGIGSSNHAINTMKTAFNTWGIKPVGEKKFRTGGLMDLNEMKLTYNKEIIKVAEAFFKAMKEDSGRKPSFYSLMVFKIQQKYWQKGIEFQNTVDYKYWENNGWLQKDCNFYIPNRANWFKIKFARWVGSVLAIFFI